MRSVLLSVLVVWISLLAGCGPKPPINGQGGAGGTGGSGGNVPFAVTSAAFAEGAAIPAEHQCTVISGGQNVSPPLSWSAGPAGTQSYAIVMKDTDISFNHWVIWDIPASALSLPAGVENTFQPANVSGAKQAPLNANLVGYFGPCSPTTVNTYEFRVYALPVANIAGLSQQSTMAEAAAAIVSQALASTAVAGES
jgi:Raf kinase inhibitor-like YbhB/YbcL family protein